MPHGFSQCSMSKRSCHMEVKTYVAAGCAALMASSLINTAAITWDQMLADRSASCCAGDREGAGLYQYV